MFLKSDTLVVNCDDIVSIEVIERSSHTVGTGDDDGVDFVKVVRSLKFRLRDEDDLVYKGELSDFILCDTPITSHIPPYTCIPAKGFDHA